MKKKSTLTYCIATTMLVLSVVGGKAALASTLDIIKDRGMVRCAVHTGLAGMSLPDSQGKWSGLFVDYCRALAAATLGDANKVEFVPVTSKQRFTVLQSGEVDVLSRTTTVTLSRDSSLGLNFTGVMFYDGQSFLVRKELGISSAKELDGATICVKQGTTAELTLSEYFERNGMTYTPVVFEGTKEATTAFFSDRCDAYTTDASALTSIRLSDAPDPDDYVVLPERISKEPLGATVRSDDDQWFDINKWLLNNLLAAEELGVTAANIDKMKSSDNATIQRITGVKPGMGKALGLDEEWSYRAIKAVGNYGELYAKHIKPLGIERGANNLYRDGGLMYPLPIR
ncbi:amino acid ABC transporter substrate-binding protein [Aestuariispira ectoiniformans]|uniref:amino acid ABC transporter substrate-binding protein n=1 Tax=Aestuariispira ectoiniformans TaxID=2775080 RepID=UPI00223AD709|nr:amino acid ABC transporter substrate-binding protein [Aestuariispira ectoiniformans]